MDKARSQVVTMDDLELELIMTACKQLGHTPSPEFCTEVPATLAGLGYERI